MTAHGFEQFVQKAEASKPERSDNPFRDVELVSGRARSRAVVLRRLLELRDSGTLRLTDILRQPEQFLFLALECLTHTWDGHPATGDNPFGDMRFRFKCDTEETRQYKIGVRIQETVDVGGGIQVPNETSTYQMLEPMYVPIPGGSIVELDVVKGIRLLQMYGRELATTEKQRKQRPWIEVDAVKEGFAAVTTDTEAA